MKVLCNLTKNNETLYFFEDLTILTVFNDIGEHNRKLTHLFTGSSAKFLFEQLSTRQTKKTNLKFSKRIYDALYYKLDEASTETMMAMAKVEDYMDEKLSAAAPSAHPE